MRRGEDGRRRRPWRPLELLLAMTLLMGMVPFGANVGVDAAVANDGVWLELEAVAQGLQQPTTVLAPPATDAASSEPDLLFVLERSGRVRVIADDVLQP